MTNLPTREDGGIDFEGAANLYHQNFNELSVRELLERVSEHTRERCAKVIDYMDTTEHGIFMAETIRKLEVCHEHGRAGGEGNN